MEVKIDFDAASKAWRQNKFHIGNGYFKYICGELTHKNTPCKNKPKENGKCSCHQK